MKLYKSMLATLALAVSSVALTGCDEDLAIPPLSIPQTDVRANMTIADFKAKYWSSENNFCVQVGQNEEGEDIILGGRIAASDEGGNIYQNLILQDGTAAITIATYTSSTDGLADLHTKYKVGEEMYINVTDLYAGKYAGLFQIGTAGDYNGTPQTSKMEAKDFLSHTYLNGLPKPNELNVIEMTIAGINALKSTEELQQYQSQLVKINDVSWVGGGELTWGETGSSSTALNRYLIDAEGNRLLVRNSNKSDFCDQVLPAGHGNVVGILSYYNGTWQFLFRTPNDCTDFGGESYAPVMEGEGTAEAPFSVGGVLAGATGSDVWVTGYIVGWVEGAALADGAHFSVPASSASNILLAANPEETNVANCIPVQLVSGSAVRTGLNLKDHPEKLGKQITIKGNLEKYLGVAGLKGASQYVWGEQGGQDTPVTTAKFKKATTITSGKQYLIVASGKAAVLNTANYGYLQVVDVTDNGGVIEMDEANAYTITSTSGGYNIQMSDGRYLYQTGTYNSYNFSATAEDGSVFTVEAQSDGTFKITCVAVNKFMQYSAEYSSYGSYSDSRGELPALYEKM